MDNNVKTKAGEQEVLYNIRYFYQNRCYRKLLNVPLNRVKEEIAIAKNNGDTIKYSKVVEK